MRYLIHTIFLLALTAITACGSSNNKDNDPVNSSSTSSDSSSAASSTPSLVITKSAGDKYQHVSPGTAVTTAPEVWITDYRGNPIVGINVNFVVTQGNGSVANVNILTDATGHASCGTWTLGPEKGFHKLTAGIDGVKPVEFSAEAFNSSAEIDIFNTNKAQTNEDELPLKIGVSSTYQLASVTALANGQTTPMTMDDGDWVANLSLIDWPRGAYTIILTATDIFGNSTDDMFSHRLDRNPKISWISAPADGSILQSTTLEVSATCTDDDLTTGCTHFGVLATRTEGFAEEYRIRYTSTDFKSLTTTLDLSGFTQPKVTVSVYGGDSALNGGSAVRNLYIDTSPHLVLHANVNGTVWDASESQVLFLDQSSVTPGLKVLDLTTGTTQLIDSSTLFNSGAKVIDGFLTSTGAIYKGLNDELYESRSGVVTKLAKLHTVSSTIYSPSSLRVAGNWASYETNEDFSHKLWRRDLVSGISTELATPKDLSHDVAANGDVVIEANDSHNIFLLRGNTTQQLTNDIDYINAYPITNGINVAYTKQQGFIYNIAMHDGTQETILSTTASRPIPGSSYALAGEYVAYLKKDDSNHYQIWRRSLEGEEQITFFGSGSIIDAIAPDGTILLSHSSKRYRAVPGTALEEISLSHGRIVVRDGKFFEIIAHSVFEVK